MGCGEAPEYLQRGRWAWGPCLDFTSSKFPLGADAARRELKKRKVLGWSLCLRNRGCGQRLSLFPLGRRKGEERQCSEKPPQFLQEGDLKRLGWFQKFPPPFSLSRQQESRAHGEGSDGGAGTEGEVQKSKSCQDYLPPLTIVSPKVWQTPSLHGQRALLGGKGGRSKWKGELTCCSRNSSPAVSASEGQEDPPLDSFVQS